MSKSQNIFIDKRLQGLLPLLRKQFVNPFVATSFDFFSFYPITHPQQRFPVSMFSLFTSLSLPRFMILSRSSTTIQYFRFVVQLLNVSPIILIEWAHNGRNRHTPSIKLLLLLLWWLSSSYTDMCLSTAKHSVPQTITDISCPSFEFLIGILSFIVIGTTHFKLPANCPSAPNRHQNSIHSVKVCLATNLTEWWETSRTHSFYSPREYNLDVTGQVVR